MSAATVALVQFAKWSGIPDKTGPLAVLVISALGVVLWGWSGVWGFSRASGEVLTKSTAPPSGAGASPTVKDE